MIHIRVSLPQFTAACLQFWRREAAVSIVFTRYRGREVIPEATNTQSGVLFAGHSGNLLEKCANRGVFPRPGIGTRLATGNAYRVRARGHFPPDAWPANEAVPAAGG